MSVTHVCVDQEFFTRFYGSHPMLIAEAVKFMVENFRHLYVDDPRIKSLDIGFYQVRLLSKELDESAKTYVTDYLNERCTRCSQFRKKLSIRVHETKQELEAVCQLVEWLADVYGQAAEQVQVETEELIAA